MKELIERLENADGPDRDLDRAIFVSQGGDGLDWSCPYFTLSIDNALTLIPEAATKWRCGYSERVPHTADVFIPHLGRFEGESDINKAIALCIAALKARENGK